MSTLIMLIISILFEVFDLLIWKRYKKTPQAIICAIIGINVVFNAVILILRLQLEPFPLGLEVALILAFQLIFILYSAPELRVISISVLIVIALAFLVVHNSSVVKEFDGKECVGLYQKATGFGETKVTYYEKKAYPFISAKPFCTENYGVILGEPDFDRNEPFSVEYFEN